MTAPTAFFVDSNSSITPHVSVAVDPSTGAPTMLTVDGAGNPVSTGVGGGGGSGTVKQVGGVSPDSGGNVALASTNLSDGTALNTAVANKLALPSQSYNAATNTPTITQGSPLIVSSVRVFSVVCTVASTSSAGPSATMAVGDWLADNGTGTWTRIPAPPATTGPICGDGLGGERAGIPGVDFAQPWQFNCKIPIGNRPVGITIGTNGAATTAPFSVVYGPTGGVAGIWIYLLANDLFAGSAAGYRWYVASSTTAGTFYNEMYVPGSTTAATDGRTGGVLGSPMPPATPTAVSGAGAGVALAADTNRRTILALGLNGIAGQYPLTLPVGFMGGDGWYEYEYLARFPATASSKTISATLGGSAAGTNSTQYSTVTLGSGNTSAFIRGRVENRHSQSSQIANNNASTGAETSQQNSNPGVATVNTAAACYATLDFASGGDWLVIELARLRIVPN